MAHADHTAPAAALPARPDPGDVEDALNAVGTRAYLGSARHCADTLAAELLHVRHLSDEAGNDWARTYVQLDAVRDAWERVDRDELATDYPDLAAELDELRDGHDGTSRGERHLAALRAVADTARAFDNEPPSDTFRIHPGSPAVLNLRAALARLHRTTEGR